MPEPEKILRKLPTVIFVYLIFMFGLCVIRSFGDTQIILDVRTKQLPVKTYTRIELGENTFITGLDGKVYWKAKSFKEAFILRNIVDVNSVTSLLNILYFFILNCILYWMVYDIKQENFFNSKVVKGIRIIGIMIVLFGVFELLKSAVSDYFLNEITRGQFRAPRAHPSMISYFIIAMFLQAIPVFIMKAQKNQQDQEYTI